MKVRKISDVTYVYENKFFDYEQELSIICNYHSTEFMRIKNKIITLAKCLFTQISTIVDFIFLMCGQQFNANSERLLEGFS